MPTYEYKCSMCGHELEEFQKMSDDPLVTCPECSNDTLEKQLSLPRVGPVVGSGDTYDHIRDEFGHPLVLKGGNKKEQRREIKEAAEKRYKKKYPNAESIDIDIY